MKYTSEINHIIRDRVPLLTEQCVESWLGKQPSE